MRSFVIGAVLAIVLLLSCSKPDNEEWGAEEWSFVVFSDLQQGYGVYSKLALHIGNIRPVPLLAACCGDLMLRPGNEAELASFFMLSEPITEPMPFYLARGNHEGNDPASEAFLRDHFNLPDDKFYYDARHKNCLFVFLDTQERGEEDRIGSIQFSWLEDLLDKTRTDSSISFVFIFMHKPIFPQGKYSGWHLQNFLELHDLFRKNSKIKIVFSGHEHMFAKYRKENIMYVITGGAGGSLYHGYGGDYHHFTKVSFYKNGGRINIKTIGIFNEIVEDFNL